VPALWIGLVVVLALPALLPVRRLYQDGWRGRRLEVAFLGIWALAAASALVPGLRWPLAPFLLLAFIGPFVAVRDPVRTLRGIVMGRTDTERRTRRLKDVTPRDDS
jgi:hypothetical protein